MLNPLQWFHKESFGGRMQDRMYLPIKLTVISICSGSPNYHDFHHGWTLLQDLLYSLLTSLCKCTKYVLIDVLKLCEMDVFSVAIGWEKSNGTAQSIIDMVHLHFWLLLWSNIICYKHEVCNISNLNDYIITKIGGVGLT